MFITYSYQIGYYFNDSFQLTGQKRFKHMAKTMAIVARESYFCLSPVLDYLKMELPER